ncbi:hypothetical protein GVAV_001287 [Gurleya vavrai]
MTTENINDLYPLSALFMHACEVKITPVAMESLFKSLNAEYLPKLGKMFCESSDKIEEYMSFVGAAPLVAVEEKKEEVKKEEVKKEEKAEVVDLAFDDLFG